MTRDEFRTKVLGRDKSLCVMCKQPAADAHHILERRLFLDGGYQLANGASLCTGCHIKAEMTLITPEQLYECIGEKRVLPEHLYPDYIYTKWGDIQNNNGTRFPGELFHDESVQKILAEGKVLDLYLPYVKYPRTFHLPFSPSISNDDRVLKSCTQFEGKEIVVVAKLDGENTTGYQNRYIHARSMDSENHFSRNWVKNRLAEVLYELPEGWRICVENMYAKHSIHYKHLKSYCYLISIWNEKNECLSWEETIDWAALLGIPLPTILYQGYWNPVVIKQLYRSEVDGDPCEGFVVRNINAFPYARFAQNTGKYVRAGHIQTNQHWIKTNTQNELEK